MSQFNMSGRNMQPLETNRIYIHVGHHTEACVVHDITRPQASSNSKRVHNDMNLEQAEIVLPSDVSSKFVYYISYTSDLSIFHTVH